jgi:F-type H+-transporting ATPase subunit epsilon
MATAQGRQLQCVVVTPEQSVLDEPVDFVALPMYDGELGVMPGRAPLIGRLGPGELRTRRGGQTHRYYVDGGFAQVRANVVTVLTPRAVPAGEISIPAAEHSLAEAQKPPQQGESLDNKLKAQEKARAQIRVARRKDSPVS